MLSKATIARNRRERRLYQSGGIFAYNAFFGEKPWSQSYTGANRTYIGADGLLKTAAANTPIVEWIGGVPMLRVEPAAANILLGAPPVTQDITLGTGSFTLQVFGAGTAVSSAGTATITGAGTASNGTPNTFTVTASGTVTITISTATVVWLIPGSIPSSYFAGAVAIGVELVTDGGFAAVTEGAEMSSGLLTIGNCYKITARTDGDFIAAGSPDNNVNTYFNATTTGAGLLDAGDKVVPITFTNWTCGTGWAPQATAGALTGKAQKIAGTASALTQNVASEIAKAYRLGITASVSAGSIPVFRFGNSLDGIAISATGSFWSYQKPTGVGGGIYIFASDTFAGTIDDVSVKEHGSVRLSEAGTVTLAMPAAVTAMLAAGTGTIVIKGRFAFARATGVVTAILSSQDATASLAYTTTTAGNLTTYDGTTVAESTGAYTANVDWKIAITFPSDTNKYRIGVDANGAGIVQGTEAAFDGDFTATANLILGRVLHGATWIKYIKFFDKVLMDAQLNAM